jgi:hypothetical protein
MAITAEDILHKYEPAIATLGLQLREYLLTTLPGITEMPDPPANIIV